MFMKLDAITKVYGDFIAVNELSLDIEKGTFLTLLGPSGSGKTTTLRMIAGFIFPTGGHIYLKDEIVDNKPPHKRNMAMVFQSFALFPHMNVFENISFGLKMRKVPEDEIKKRVTHILELVRLPGYEKRYPRQMSGGEQQRVALGRCLVIEPDVLLLDEPLSNLDLKLREAMRLEIKQIQKDLGITTIYVTHDQSEALIMSDRIAVMNKGRLAQVGSPKEVYQYPKSKFVASFIGEANFFEGKLVSVNECEAIVMAGSSTLHCSTECLKYHSKAIEESTNVIVSIRPTNAILSKNKQQYKNTFRCEIENVEYVGSFVKYHCALESGGRIIVEMREDVYKIGDEAYVGWPAESCMIVSE
jgi:spermidine/putrescine ABC transporter ATP-binding subunit